MDSAKAELARRILETLAKGAAVTFDDAIRLRKWAVRPEDALLPLAEIALGILAQEANSMSKSAKSGQ